MNFELEKLDDLYTRYGYNSKSNHKNTKVYVYTKGIYPGADIIKLNNEGDIELLKKEYTDQGYAVKVRSYDSISTAEETLFVEFFKADGVKSNLKKKYNSFIDRIMINLPENAAYQYINSQYELNEIDSTGVVIRNDIITPENLNHSIVNDIVDLIQTKDGPTFIILEAAAGYGKTCTAYEILNKFLEVSLNKVPFFTELSRDRTAAIFKHILQNEIEEQFSGSVNSKVVIQEIKSGRIPLIIDGFDELISKDFSFSSSEFQQVESMLSTIIDLLSDNAKIIITSRKTAIFNSTEFFNYIENRGITYSLIRIGINEPSVENWLTSEQIEILENENFPIQNVSNPVLLTFIKHTSEEKLKHYVRDAGSIVNFYFDFLLEREKIRQELPMDADTQMRIYRKLVRLFTELDIKSASKDDVKTLIMEYNKKLLDEFIKVYPSDRRPRIDQLADTLTNHAFLDKKDGRTIGFINEFILGTLIGQNLILKKYQEHQSNYYKSISQQFALLAIDAYKVQPKKEQDLLWKIFNEPGFKYDVQFYFKLDFDLQGETSRTYSEAYFEGHNLTNQYFTNENQFANTTFTKCIFNNCTFNFKSFTNCSFANCQFFHCILEKNSSGSSTFHINELGCYANNNFINELYYDSSTSYSISENIEKKVMEMLFQQGSLRPRHKLLSLIKTELESFDPKEVSKTINKLKSDSKIQFNGDLVHITQLGIKYFNEEYR